MAVVLGVGDSFHLIPRALALCTTGLESYTVYLGIGKLITSVTMTVFYILLYYVWRITLHSRFLRFRRSLPQIPLRPLRTHIRPLLPLLPQQPLPD